MRAALLCPGDSLQRFPGPETYDVVIGVNRVAGSVPCHYAAMLDMLPYQMLRRSGGDFIGTPVHVTGRTERRKLAIEFPDVERFPFVDWSTISAVPRGIRWGLYSATMALVLARSLGATEVECWGVDWRGAADWDGTTHQKFVRNDERWKNEIGIWHATVQAIGIPVVRCQEAMA